MITNDVIFVLGAGASKPYGYPTGLDLRHFLAGRLDHRLVKRENDYLALDILKEFKTDFQYSGDASIDRFIETRPEYNDFGKRAIAFYLGWDEYDWYGHDTFKERDIQVSSFSAHPEWGA